MASSGTGTMTQTGTHANGAAAIIGMLSAVPEACFVFR